MRYKYKVSVIVPVYNTSKYLPEMMDSLARQTLDNFEVIFIDDGSVDNSAEVIKDYITVNNIDYMKYIYQENSGPSAARNKGLDMAQGEFISFADSDDKFPPNALKSLYDKAVENNAEVVLGGTHRFDSKREWRINGHFFDEGYKTVIKNKRLLSSLGLWNKLYRSTLLKDIRFPLDLYFGEDQCFVIEVYLKAKKVYTIDELVYYYREREIGEGSLTGQCITNPNAVLKQSVEMCSRIYSIIDRVVDNEYDKNYMKSNYVTRLIDIEVWKMLENAIDSKDGEVQVTALKYILELINNVDIEAFNESFSFHRLCTAWIIDRYLLLSKEARKIHMEIIQTFFSKLYYNSYLKIEKRYPILVPVLKRASEKDSVKIIKKYLLKRRLKKSRKEFDDNMKIKLRNPILKIGGTFRSIDENKLILASNKGANVSGNLASIETTAKSMVPDLDIHCYFTKKRTLSETIKMYWDFSNAKNIVLDDYYNQLYNAKLNKGVNVIQVWHGCGAFKKFGFSALGCGDSNTLEFEQGAHLHYTHVITSGKEVNKHYAEAFKADESKVLALGVPRTDVFFDKEYINYTKDAFVEKFPDLNGKKIILYAPTFRGNPTERKKFNMKLDYEYWCSKMPPDCVLVLKMHPCVKKKASIPEEYADKIIDLSDSADIQDLMIVSDVLITDYSSVVFEYALLNKPMIFFAYDLEDYVDERGFYYEYRDFVPGNIVKTTEEIVDTILTESYEVERLKSFRNKFFDDFDGQASKRFCEHFLLNK